MVRETRYLWVGNLPESVSEERIKEHFKRYGPVQSVKLGANADATVAYVDICSATKALKVDHRLDERLLKTTYHEPSVSVLTSSHYPSSGSTNNLHRSDSHYNSSNPQNSSLHGGRSPRFTTNLGEDHSSYERSSHFYESRREDAITYNGHGTSSGSNVAGSLRRSYISDRDSESRGRIRAYPSRSHFQSNGRPETSEYRWGGGQYRYHSDSYSDDKIRRTTSAPSPPPSSRSIARSSRATGLPAKRRPPNSRSGSESPSSSRSSRSSSSSSSNSSSSRSSSSQSSVGRSSRSVSPSPRRFNGPTGPPSGASSTPDSRSTAICVRKLPPWSLDNSLKDGLFHDYKKFGKVTLVRIFGTGSDRYGVVCFKKADDAEKALVGARGKQFFGVDVEVIPHEAIEQDESECRSYDQEMDEYSPKATRTLFIGGLDKDITTTELRKLFEPFGEVIDIDIKNQNLSTFAFCQYSDIRSVVQAAKKMDGEYIGANRIKLGFGKSMQNRCIWVGGVSDSMNETTLTENFSRFGAITNCQLDRERGHALISFESERQAGHALTEMRGCSLNGRRIQVDYASRECQSAFYSNVDKSNYSSTDRSWERRDIDKFERSRRDTSYSARQIPATQRLSSYTSTRTRRYETYEEFPSGRSYEEFVDDSFERDLHEYAGRQRFENVTLPTTANNTVATPPVSANRSYTPTRIVEDKVPFSPKLTPRLDNEVSSPVVRPIDEAEGKKNVQRSPPPFESELFHTHHSPPLTGKLSPPKVKTSASKITMAEPSTPVCVSPSREVSVMDDKVISDPRRRKPPDFKSLVVKVNENKKSSDIVPRQKNSTRKNHHESDREWLHDPRLNVHREEIVDHVDDRLEDVEKSKKSGCHERHNNRRGTNANLEGRGHDGSTNFRKPYDGRKVSEAKSKRDNGKIVSEFFRERMAHPNCDPRYRKMSGSLNMEDCSWNSKMTTCPPLDSDISPPGTPVRDERDEPAFIFHGRHYYIPSYDYTIPLNLPLPKFCQSKTRLSPRCVSASPRTTPVTPVTTSCSTQWLPEKPSILPAETDSILADTPVSPGPIFQDISDSEDSLTDSPISQGLDIIEQIRSLDVKFEKWSGTTRGATITNGFADVEDTRPTTKVLSEAVAETMKRIPSLEECSKPSRPSPILESVLSKKSIFDEDIARLSKVDEKYQPKPYTGSVKLKSFDTWPTTTPSSSVTKLVSIPSATPLSSLPGIRPSAAALALPSSPNPYVVKSTPKIISIASSITTTTSVLTLQSSITDSSKMPIKPIVNDKTEDISRKESYETPISGHIHRRRSSAGSSSSTETKKVSSNEESVGHEERQYKALMPSTPVKSIESEDIGPVKEELPLISNIETPLKKFNHDGSSNSSQSPKLQTVQHEKSSSRKRNAESDRVEEVIDDSQAKNVSVLKRIRLQSEEEKENRTKLHKENHKRDKFHMVDKSREVNQGLSVASLCPNEINNEDKDIKMELPKDDQSDRERRPIVKQEKLDKAEIKDIVEKPSKVPSTNCAQSKEGDEVTDWVDMREIKKERKDVKNEVETRSLPEDYRLKENRRDRSRKGKDRTKDKHRNNCVVAEEKNRDKNSCTDKSKSRDRDKHRSCAKTEKGTHHQPSVTSTRDYNGEISKDYKLSNTESGRSKKNHKSSRCNSSDAEGSRTFKSHGVSKSKECDDKNRSHHTKDKLQKESSGRKIDRYTKVDDSNHIKMHGDRAKRRAGVGGQLEDLKAEDISSDEEYIKSKGVARQLNRTKERIEINSNCSRRNEKIRSNVESDVDSLDSEGEERKKSSYFDIPVYSGNMYDTVKARTVRHNQKEGDKKSAIVRNPSSKSRKSKKKSRSSLSCASDLSDDMGSERNRRIVSTSEDEMIKVRPSNAMSSDEFDSTLPVASNIDDTQKGGICHTKPPISDISTDEDTVLNQSSTSISSSHFDSSLLISRKRSSDSDTSDCHARKPPRPSLTASRHNIVTDKMHRRSSHESTEDSSTNSSCRPREYPLLHSNLSTLKKASSISPEKTDTDSRMKSIFGGTSDDSDSNIGAALDEHYDNNLVRDSLRKPYSHVVSPCRKEQREIIVQTSVFESDIDEDSRPLTPDILRKHRPVESSNHIESSVENIAHKNHTILTAEDIECKDELIRSISPGWRESNKDNLSEVSRSDSGKGSSCGVSSTSSSSSSEELLLLENNCTFTPDVAPPFLEAESINKSSPKHTTLRKDKKKRKHKDKSRRSSNSRKNDLNSRTSLRKIQTEVIRIDCVDVIKDSPRKTVDSTVEGSPESIGPKTDALDMPFIGADYSNDASQCEVVSLKESPVRNGPDEVLVSAIEESDKVNTPRTKTSRSNISQEETQNAVAGLLACYNDYPDSPSSQNIDELTGETNSDEANYQCVEAQTAAEIITCGMPTEEHERSSTSVQEWNTTPPTPSISCDDARDITVVPSIISVPDPCIPKQKTSLPSDHFPESPASVQSEPALEIDEDATSHLPTTSDADLKSCYLSHTVDSDVKVAINSLPTAVNQSPAVVELHVLDKPVKLESKVTLDNSILSDEKKIEVSETTDLKVEVKQEDCERADTLKEEIEKTDAAEKEVPDEQNSSFESVVNEISETKPTNTDTLESKEEIVDEACAVSPIKDSFSTEKENETPFRTRGRWRGRGKRGGRGGNRSEVSMEESHTIVTRSSVATRSSKTIGSSGRTRRSNDNLTEEESAFDLNTVDHTPRRSTRTKRARKHPDMVEHDETTMRRRRNVRGSSRSSNLHSNFRLANANSDVYDFHDSDDEDMGVGRKGKKDAVSPLPSQTASANLTKEDESGLDFSNPRKSPRLKDKLDEENIAVHDQNEINQLAIAKKRPRVRSRDESEDTSTELISSPMKKQRKIIKTYEAEKLNQSLTENETPVVFSSVPVSSTVIQHAMTAKPLASATLFASVNVSHSSKDVKSPYAPLTNSPVKLSLISANSAANKSPVSYILATPPNINQPLNATVPVSSSTEPVILTTKTISSVEGYGKPRTLVQAKHLSNASHDKEHSPTPLVDPVTGHLTPMNIDDQGQYIPVSGEQVMRTTGRGVRGTSDKLTFTTGTVHSNAIRQFLPSNLTVTTVASGESATTTMDSRQQNTLSISRISEVSVEMLPKGKLSQVPPVPSQKDVYIVPKTSSQSVSTTPVLISGHGGAQIITPANIITSTINHPKGAHTLHVKGAPISAAQISITPKVCSPKVPLAVVSKPSIAIEAVPAPSHVTSNRSTAQNVPSHTDNRSVITSNCSAEKVSRLYVEEARPHEHRYHEAPVIEVTRMVPSPRAQDHDSTAGLLAAGRPPFDVHASTHVRPNIGCASPLQSSQPAKAGHYFSGSREFVVDMHTKTGPPAALSPAHAVVTGNVAVPGVMEQFLTASPLSTPPAGSELTPPPAHHNQRENAQPAINNLMYRVPPYIMPTQRTTGYEQVGVAMPMDLKLTDKNTQMVDAEFISRQATVLASHDRSPHQLMSPHYDRTTDSPKMVGTLHSRHYAPHFDYPVRAATPVGEHDSRSPAHLFTSNALPAADIPLGSPQYPPHDNLPLLLQHDYQAMWEGFLGLKNDQAHVKMHYVSGSIDVARVALAPSHTSILRISQRMRLEQSQLEGVARKMQLPAEHCVLLAIPCGSCHVDFMKQQINLETGFIKYLGDKKAAGIVNVPAPGSRQSAFVIHIFPPCDFSKDNLSRVAPVLMQNFGTVPRMMVVIATC